MEPEENTETRLRFLEQHVAIQEQLLVGIQAERIEAERLSESVTRLGLGASDLGKALREVDRQQQLLTRLGREVEAVQAKTDEIDEKAVSKEELEAREAEKERERQRREREVEQERERKAAQLAAEEKARRRKQFQRLIGWSVIVATVIGVGALLAAMTIAARERDQARFRHDVYNICEARAEQARRIRALLQREPPVDAEAAATRQLLLAAFPVIPCDDLKQ